MPKGIYVDPDYIRSILSYDRETGTFHWKQFRSANAQKGQLAGCVKSNGRRVIRILGRLEFCNRLAWIYETGQQPKGEIDHIDGNPSNDAFSNLRDVTHSQNLQNLKRPKSNNKLGILGVHFQKDRGKYLAQIKLDGRNFHLGRFESAADAEKAYKEAKISMHIVDTPKQT